MQQDKRKHETKSFKKSIKIEDAMFFPEDFKKLPKKAIIIIKQGRIMIQWNTPFTKTYS